jgi:hypothetical protein
LAETGEAGRRVSGLPLSGLLASGGAGGAAPGLCWGLESRSAPGERKETAGGRGAGGAVESVAVEGGAAGERSGPVGRLAGRAAGEWPCSRRASWPAVSS